VVQKAVIKALELSWGAEALALNEPRKEAPKSRNDAPKKQKKVELTWSKE